MKIGVFSCENRLTPYDEGKCGTLGNFGSVVKEGLI